jgi:hypothetical protein
MRKLATKLACATVCLLLLCAGNRSEAASLTDQEEALSNQQIAKVKELIHDAVQPSMDIINRKIDALVGVIEASHLSPGRSGQVQQIADYKPAKPEYNNNNGNEDEDNNNNDEHERKYEVKKYYYYIYCCHPRSYHCCRSHCCRSRCDDCDRPRCDDCDRPRCDGCDRPRCDGCDRPRCYKSRYHYCRPRGDDP